jgi:3-oxoacyl-[acyl-carrier protein] reductase
MKIPGPGALWISQSLEFKAPARIGDQLQVIAEVTAKSDSQRILELDIKVVTQNKVVLITGQSKVKVVEFNSSSEKEEKKEVAKPVVLISGAAKGIGAAIAQKIAIAGYPVAINYNSSVEDAEFVLEEITSKGGTAAIFKANITDEKQVKSMVQNIENTLGKVGILINNASGVIRNKKFADLDWKDIQDHLDVQIKGSFNLCKAVLPGMEENKTGRIINISSIYADGVPPTQTYDYVLAKAALSSFTKSLAVEFSPKGITVNNIAPGMTETTLISDVPDKTKLVTKMQTPLRRLGHVEDIANVALMLMGDAGNYITGETIRVCGGQQMI